MSKQHDGIKVYFKDELDKIYKIDNKFVTNACLSKACDLHFGGNTIKTTDLHDIVGLKIESGSACRPSLYP